MLQVKMRLLQYLALLTTLLPSLTLARPAQALTMNFPDPSITYDPQTKKWYTFATAGNGLDMQVAQAENSTGPWEWTSLPNILPTLGAAFNVSAGGIWAPDVRYLKASESASYVMYYSATYTDDDRYHCVGTATAQSILGPWTAQEEPFACQIDQGGAIDPSGYWDQATQTQWVVYKVDGNSKGNGGDCGNTVEPIVSTPLMLQQVNVENGWEKIGSPIQLLDRGPDDGPLIEAPNLIRALDGTYVLFFSSNCWYTPYYDVSYATATTITGPYTKSEAPLMVTGTFGLTSPGGATSTMDGRGMIFHANCEAGRCPYQSSFCVENGIVTIT